MLDLVLTLAVGLIVSVIVVAIITHQEEDENE